MRELAFAVYLLAAVGVRLDAREEVARARPTSDSFRRPRSANPAKPPAVTVDFDKEVGNNDKLSQFIKDSKNGVAFGTPKDAPVADGNGGWCHLQISPATGSLEIPKKKDGSSASAYIVALIENPATSGCNPKSFPLRPGQRAVWLVRFETPVVIPVATSVGLGKARVVVLADQGDPRDEWLVEKLHWKLGQCAHNLSNATYDRAEMLSRSTVCSITSRFRHNSDSVAAYLNQRAKTKSPTPTTAADDPALWFLCGTDCCYADIKS